MSAKLTFTNTNESTFFTTVRSRVDIYFRSNNISRHANIVMWCKAIFLILGFTGIYLLILSNSMPPWQMFWLAGLLGGFGALIGFNICHDAIHGAFSKNKTVNKIFGLLFNCIGANAYVWHLTHNMIHHTYTNIEGVDEDLEPAPGIIRLSDQQKVTSLQKYQHVYAFFLYGLSSLSWVFRKDFVKFFKTKIGNYDNIKHPTKEYFKLFFFKGIYYFLFIVLPLLFLPITLLQFVAGFLIMHFIQGLILGVVFQLAHVVEGTRFPLLSQSGKIEDAWADHQMKTTANFATSSRLTNFLCGGLNFQIEHHLFPKICHVHYPALSKLVKKTALEFDLPYIEYSTFHSAVLSHYGMLKRLGKDAFVQKTPGTDEFKSCQHIQ